MTEDAIREKLATILVEDFAKDPEVAANGKSTFRGELGMDSLDVVDLVFFIKQEFGVDAKMEAYRELHTVDKVVRFIASRTEG